jgi:hypothetical protein
VLAIIAWSKFAAGVYRGWPLSQNAGFTEILSCVYQELKSDKPQFGSPVAFLWGLLGSSVTGDFKKIVGNHLTHSYDPKE